MPIIIGIIALVAIAVGVTAAARSNEPQDDEGGGLFERDEWEGSRRSAPNPSASSRTVPEGVAPPAQNNWFGRIFGQNAGGFSWSRAESELREGLEQAGSRVVPGRLYVVQLDRANRGRSDAGELDGRTYVMKGRADGSLQRLDWFRSTSQPTNPDATAYQSAEGVAHIRQGLYRVATHTRFSQALRTRVLDFQPMSGIPTSRDGWRGAPRDGRISASEINASTRAGGILFHDASLGSRGCQLVVDFARFARLIALHRGNTGSFEYLLVRDGDPWDMPDRVRVA